MVRETTYTRLHAAFVTLVGTCMILSIWGCAETELPTQVPSDCPMGPTTMTDYAAAGLKGIKLKVDTECKFQIDLGASDRLRWDRFVGRNRNVYVRMRIWIDQDGRVVRIYDEKHGGQRTHLNELRKTVGKWVYKGGCFYGELRLMFVGADSKLYIDRSDLKITPGYERCNLRRNLRLHAIYKGSRFEAEETKLSW